jgi:hypothetical protein
MEAHASQAGGIERRVVAATQQMVVQVLADRRAEHEIRVRT